MRVLLRLRMFLGLVFLVTIVTAQSKADKDRLSRLERFLIDHENFVMIKKDRGICEDLVRQLKLNELDNSRLEGLYKIVETDYNKLMNKMIDDVEEVTTVGDMADHLIYGSSKRMVWDSLASKATISRDAFLAEAEKQLENTRGSSAASAGIIGSVINWSLGLLPSYISKISDSLIDIVRKKLIRKLEELAFKPWDEVY
jgi:hypothetical protein